MNLIGHLLKSGMIVGMFVLLLSIFPNCSSSDSDDGGGGTADSDDTAAGGTVATSTIGGFGSGADSADASVSALRKPLAAMGDYACSMTCGDGDEATDDGHTCDFTGGDGADDIEAISCTASCNGGGTITSLLDLTSLSSETMSLEMTYDGCVFDVCSDNNWTMSGEGSVRVDNSTCSATWSLELAGEDSDGASHTITVAGSMDFPEAESEGTIRCGSPSCEDIDSVTITVDDVSISAAEACETATTLDDTGECPI